jgi:hypothetical protein
MNGCFFVAQSSPDHARIVAEETVVMGREVESHQGVGCYFKADFPDRTLPPKPSSNSVYYPIGRSHSQNSFDESHSFIESVTFNESHSFIESVTFNESLLCLCGLGWADF